MVRTTFFALVALAAGGALADSVGNGAARIPVAEASQPKFYFPRHVKRQAFSNSSTPVVPVSPSTSFTPETTSPPAVPVSSSAINSVLSSVLSSIFQPSPSTSAPGPVETHPSTSAADQPQITPPPSSTDGAPKTSQSDATAPTDATDATAATTASYTTDPAASQSSAGAAQTNPVTSQSSSAASPSDAAAAQTSASGTSPSEPTSIGPTGSDTMTAQFVGTAIVTATTPSPNPTTSNAPTGISTEVPRLVKPPDGIIPVQPDNTTLVQIGFNYPLNYYFVVSSQNAIKQIFWYLPQGVAYGLGVDVSEVTMQLLEPYDTTRTLGYVTTLAKIFIRKDMLDALSLATHQPASHLYNNLDPSVHALMSMINPSIPIQGGDLNNPGGGSGTGSSNPAASGNSNDGAPLGSNSASSSSPVSATSVGIGCGVVAGAAIYGAAMFFIARRYKQRRMLHRRSPSLIDTASMSQTRGEMVTGAGTALMGGARQYNPYQDHEPSGRTSRGSGSSRGRDISAPVMAENSLGWN